MSFVNFVYHLTLMQSVQTIFKFQHGGGLLPIQRGVDIVQCICLDKYIHGSLFSSLLFVSTYQLGDHTVN